MDVTVPTHELRFHGTCDASAALLLPGGRLVVANDEDDRLRVYDVTRGGEPTQTLELFGSLPRPDGSKREADIEGVAVLEGMQWWIGSHARDSDGDKCPNRRVLVATQLRVEGGRVGMEVMGAHYSTRRQGLLGTLLSLPEIGQVLSKAEQLPPKVEGGFNIEGLAALGNTLLLGLRNPIVDGRAIVVRVPRPASLLGGEEPDPSTWQWHSLDLGGRGIRALAAAPGRDGLLVSAGAIGEGDDFALYHWSGGAEPPRLLNVSLRGLRVESIVPLPDGRVLALSDDGSLERRGKRCKDLPLPERAFRAQAFALP
jgi:hypothetical protein